MKQIKPIACLPDFTEKVSYCLSGELTEILHEKSFSKDGSMTWPLDFVSIEQIAFGNPLFSLANKTIVYIDLSAKATKMKNLEKLLALDYVEGIHIDSSIKEIFHFELYLSFEYSKMNCSKLLKKYKFI